MSKRPKRLMYAGGGVLLLGIILGQFFGLTPGINTDSGPGEVEKSTAEEEENQTVLASSDSDVVPILIEPEPKPKQTQLELPIKVLDVLIEERSYLIKSAAQGKDAYRPAEIEEIIGLAKQATGDEDGIRIRVYRKGSARVVPESQLKAALKNAGVSAESIDWKTHLVD